MTVKKFFWNKLHEKKITNSEKKITDLHNLTIWINLQQRKKKNINYNKFRKFKKNREKIKGH